MQKKYICSFSGGKDSTATVILAHEHQEPLDTIIFSEVMFDHETSGELPEHIEFIKKAFKVFEQWGYQTKILRYSKTYMDYFNQVRKRGKNAGKQVGFPMADKCNARNCKIKPIEAYMSSMGNDYAEYIGIASDEPLRLSRLDNQNKISLLAKYGYTENMAIQKCMEYDLLSPYYSYSKRGGCWFCPNGSISQFRYLRKEHPELWKKLLMLEERTGLAGPILNTQTGRSAHQIEENLYWEEAQMDIFEYLRMK